MVKQNSDVRQDLQMCRNRFWSAYFYGISSASLSTVLFADREMIESLSNKVSKKMYI